MRFTEAEAPDRRFYRKQEQAIDATKPYAEAHFATFPPALIEPCIALSTDIRIQEERGNFETRWLLKSKVERMSVTPTIAPVKRRSPIKR